MSWDEDQHDEGISFAGGREAVQYVLENHRDEVEDVIRWTDAQQWLEGSQPWFPIINIVCRHDRESFRDAIRKWVDPSLEGMEGPSQGQLFAIASEVSELLESARSPYAESCAMDGDLEWAGDLVRITRALRDVLLAIADPRDSWTPDVRPHTEKASTAGREDVGGKAMRLSASWQFDGPVERFNSILQFGVFERLAARTDGKVVWFERTFDTGSTSLPVALARWISDYLTRYWQYVRLAVCGECCRLFERERRDNVYCSKTCQNRVAYKRKKIFEAGVLRELKVEPQSLETGLWLYHPRLGLGVVEEVNFLKKRLTKLTKENVGAKDDINPQSVWTRVRFLPAVRTLWFNELFGKRGESAPAFYQVQDGKRLLELL